MAINWQKGALFAAGIAVGVAGGVWGVMSLKDGRHEEVRPAAQVAPTSAMGAPAAAPSTVAVAAPAGTCEQSPMLAKGADADGRESLLSKGGTSSASEVSSMILSGKEAAASGRPRDAEVFFLNACRQAASLTGKERIALADAMYQLGRHYANVAALGAARPKDLYERAERLYSASLEAYTARYGASHEKTKFAQGGLTTVLQATNGSGVAAFPKPAPAPVVVQAPPAAVPVTPAAQVAAAPPPVLPSPPPLVAAVPVPAAKPAAVAPPAPVAVARRSSPSFDCAKARSTTEQLICGDEELARMDRELGGMHQRAKQAAADPRAFQRASDAEWQRREDTCKDADCLRRWYAQRRQDLATAPTAASQPRTPPSRPAEPRVTERTAEPPEPVAQAAVRPAPPPRPRAPVVREEPAEVTIAPGVASGDSGVSEPTAPRARSTRPVDSGGAPSAEGSPNATE